MKLMAEQPGKTLPAGTYQFRLSWKGTGDSTYTPLTYPEYDENFQPTGNTIDTSTVTIPNPNKGYPTIKNGNVWNETLNTKVLDNNGQSPPVDGTTLLKPINLTSVSVGNSVGQNPGQTPHRSQVSGAKWKIELMKYIP